MQEAKYSINIISTNERLKIGSAGELSNFYNTAGVPKANLIEYAFQKSYQSIIARNTYGKIIGAVRSSFDGVYAMVWDLQVGQTTHQNNPKLKGTLLTAMMNTLKAKNHNLIAAIIPNEDVDLYHINGLPYGNELTVTTIDPSRHVLWESPHLIRQNDQVTQKEISNLFAVTGWQEEANIGEQFARAFNTALCNFTARDEHGSLIGMVRIHFDGKVAMRWNLVVHPDYRKLGLGFKLLSHLLDFIIKGDYESYALAVNYMVKSYQKLAIIPVQDKQVVTNNSKL